MKNQRVASALVIVLAVVAPAAGQTAGSRRQPSAPARSPKPEARKAFTPARTPWGDPDLQGVYTNKDESGIPIEKPSQFDGKTLDDIEDSEFAEIVRQRAEAARARAPLSGGAETGAGPIHWFENYDAKNSRAWLLVDPADGRIPPTTPESQKRAADRAAARARLGGPADSYENRSLYDQCITRGLPGSMTPAIYGNSYEIHQGQGFVAIRYEMIHETRIIPLDGRPHASARIPTYMGDARGRFDGNTLVVETTNFRDPNRGASEKLRLVERFTPVAANRVEWSVTYDDAATWARPWTFAMALTKDPTQAPFEYACHEGNYGLANILSAARAEEKK